MKNLEQYQETGRRNPTDFNAENQHISYKEELKLQKAIMERRNNFRPEKLPKKVYMNHDMKWYLQEEITPELLKKEEDWSISYLDYLQDLK